MEQWKTAWILQQQRTKSRISPGDSRMKRLLFNWRFLFSHLYALENSPVPQGLGIAIALRSTTIMMKLHLNFKKQHIQTIMKNHRVFPSWENMLNNEQQPPNV